MREVVVRKVDMDTALAGMLLGVSSDVPVRARPDGATPDELADPGVVCLEAGGSGDAPRLNFDHHGAPHITATASEQAMAYVGIRTPGVRRLVDYVSTIDVGRPHERGWPGFPTLSNVFSGAMLAHRDDPARQLRAGVAIFQRVLEEGLDPWDTMPARPEWTAFVRAKLDAVSTLATDVEHARCFKTSAGAEAGLLVSMQPGALGALYERGCVYAVAVNPACPDAGTAAIRKATIGARHGRRVDHLLAELNATEPGWGGPSHGTVVGSPGGRSTLWSDDDLIDLVRRCC